MIACSMPRCQTSAGCKCATTWPWQYPQVPTYTAGGTANPQGSLEERVAELERTVARWHDDPEVKAALHRRPL